MSRDGNSHNNSFCMRMQFAGRKEVFLSGF
ncbi:unnamed protein product [Chondrus crispus]|uniref:Uncharacterized protein n=1 Tax=Chondrus crispus TaxID=2769 RepID=R7QHY0_CHOCR|nr:unnamed protein product [Chondrus crispus]CDF37066.1 unnamed protein product [Chondrus crispus]|eukprot:XP_005716885.1 unnamed protein product [Chondrus crispus]